MGKTVNKLAIVINGRGGVGKDTLCEFAAKHYRTINISTIDPIKKIASENGWNGEKTPRARRFLSELKQVFSDYNDLPTVYAVNAYKSFLESDNELMFIHIREAGQIKHFLKRASPYGGRIVTLLVRSRRVRKSYGNSSDDEVENYRYDYSFQNDRPLRDTEEAFVSFLKEIIGKG